MMKIHKISMVWIVVAESLRSGDAQSLGQDEIIHAVREKFQKEIPPVMISGHLVGSVGRHADKNYYPKRGGGRYRYLSRDPDGRFRLYKETDGPDGWDKTKTSPRYPSLDKLPQEYHYLVEWYESEYFPS